MNILWKKVEGYMAEKPLAVDFTSTPNKVYLHKNIESVPNTDAEGTHWKYDEAFLTLNEYIEYSSKKNSADIDYIAMMSDIELEE